MSLLLKGVGGYSCANSVQDAFANLNNWTQNLVTGTDTWDINASQARFVGPDLGVSANNFLINNTLMCSANQEGSIDIVTIPVAAGIDEIGVVLRRRLKSSTTDPSYRGDWQKSGGPVHALKIKEFGVGELASAASAVAAPATIKFTASGSTLTIVLDEGLGSEETLATTDSSITNGNYCGIRAFIGEIGRVNDELTWEVDNYLCVT